MKPYTTSTQDPDDLRRNWRGNRCSKGRNGDPGKGFLKIKIGNSNYHRKKMDRANKKSARQRFKKAVLDFLKEPKVVD